LKIKVFLYLPLAKELLLVNSNERKGSKTFSSMFFDQRLPDHFKLMPTLGGSRDKFY
jgi:hypothetical protein